MPISGDAQFSVGVNYWPRASARALWQHTDTGDVRDDFAHIAALGLDAVRVFVPWDALQPAPDRIDPALLARLTTLADDAAAAGLRILPSLCGAMHGESWMPAWTRTISDLYGGPLLEAQLVIARAVGERLRAHAAIVAWDIGHAFTSVRAPRAGKVTTGEHGSAPASEAEVANWSRRIAQAYRTESIATTAGTFSGDLVHDTNIRFGSLCAPFAFASMQGSSLTGAFARNRLDPEAVPFLAMVTAAFSFKPVLVTGVGNPTCPAGKFSPYERFALPDEPAQWTVAADDPAFATYPCLGEDENAAYATAVLERLHADGRLGAYWWCWSDAPDDNTGAPDAGSYGMLRRDGSEKPVAAALAAFARTRRTVLSANDMPMISSTYYYRTLPESARTLYDAFLGFVEARREAPSAPVDKP